MQAEKYRESNSEKDFSQNATFWGIRKNIFWDDFANAFG